MRRIILVLIIILATFLRFSELNTLPELNADEAAIGYNAYSLIQTGKDEHGNSWPINFESFGDWKPGLFFYIVLPFVKFLGLNEWAVRIPGATLGVLTVLLMYFLVKELFPATGPAARSSRPTSSFRVLMSELAGARRDPLRSRHPSLALWTSLLLAISPWHIHFSRGGWEVNTGTFFVVLGIWGFLRWINIKSGKWIVISVVAFVAALYTYHAARVIVPLLTVGILIFFHSHVFKNIKVVTVSVLLGMILLMPLVKDLIGPAGAARAGGVSIFADQGIIERINRQRGEHGDISSLGAKLIHNKVVNYSWEFLQNWGEHFWGQFLFLSGDEIERNKVPEIGRLYLFQLPLLLLGLFLIARSPAGWGIILWWLVIAPTAAALTFQSPHALRAHNMVIPLTIISAFGGLKFFEWTKSSLQNKKLLVIGLLGYWVIGFWDFARYLHQYYVHMAKEYPFSSQYGVKELVSYVRKNYDKYPVFAITDRYDQPYILFLFYMKYPPEKFQGAHILTDRDKFGFSTVRDFDKFHFEEIGNWEKTSEKFRNGLIIGTGKEIDDGRNIIHRIYFPNGDVAFKIVSN